MIKKIFFVSLFILAAVALAGCLKQDMSVGIKQDGTASCQYEVMIAKVMTGTLKSSDYPKDAVVSEKSVDGTQYLCFNISKEFPNLSELKSALTSDTSDLKLFSKGFITTDTFEGNIDFASMYGEYLDSESIQEIDQMMKIEFSVTMPTPVIYTNGTVDSANPNKVKWSTVDMYTKQIFMAYCENSARYDAIKKDTKAPTIKGIANKGIYKRVKLSCSDNTGILSMTLNGKNVSNHSPLLISGKYQLTVTDLNGNISKANFRIDPKPPTVKGIKNNRTYKKAVNIKVTDKYGIKSVTINDKRQSTKKIKSGIHLANPGKYKVVVLDKTGNKTTVKFTIKK